ncbi:hypothetical protein KFE25_007338 [Diacronema lutheri]|uniref:Uncharacterized protein n=1 Tax=Diacronema lutheri TaxID=2081491 RepID=A0A8J5Y086_DIALT|nr:hypothetical protein KFE25_007338 [Diacronema lutheri]
MANAMRPFSAHSRVGHGLERRDGSLLPAWSEVGAAVRPTLDEAAARRGARPQWDGRIARADSAIPAYGASREGRRSAGNQTSATRISARDGAGTNAGDERGGGLLPGAPATTARPRSAASALFWHASSLELLELDIASSIAHREATIRRLAHFLSAHADAQLRTRSADGLLARLPQQRLELVRLLVALMEGGLVLVDAIRLWRHRLERMPDAERTGPTAAPRQFVRHGVTYPLALLSDLAWTGLDVRADPLLWRTFEIFLLAQPEAREALSRAHRHARADAVAAAAGAAGEAGDARTRRTSASTQPTFDDGALRSSTGRQADSGSAARASKAAAARARAAVHIARSSHVPEALCAVVGFSSARFAPFEQQRQWWLMRHEQQQQRIRLVKWRQHTEHGHETRPRAFRPLEHAARTEGGRVPTCASAAPAPACGGSARALGTPLVHVHASHSALVAQSELSALANALCRTWRGRALRLAVATASLVAEVAGADAEADQQPQQQQPAWPRASESAGERACAGSDAISKAASGSDAISKAAPGSDAISKAAPGSDAFSKAAPGSDAFSKAAPGSDAFSKAAPGSDAISKAAPGSDAFSKAAPGSDAFSKAAPGSDAFSKAAPGSDAISKAAPGSDAFSKAAPGSDAFSKAAPGSDAISKAAPGSDAFSKAAPGSDAFSKAAPGSDAFSKAAPGSDAISKAAPGSDAFSKAAPGSDAFSKAAPGSDTISKAAPGVRDGARAEAQGRAPSDARVEARTALSASAGGACADAWAEQREEVHGEALPCPRGHGEVHGEAQIAGPTERAHAVLVRETVAWLLFDGFLPRFHGPPAPRGLSLSRSSAATATLSSLHFPPAQSH